MCATWTKGLVDLVGPASTERSSMNSSTGHLESLLRESLVDRLVKSGHPETVKTAQELFDKYLNGDNSVPTEIRRAVRAVVLIVDILVCCVLSCFCLTDLHCCCGVRRKRRLRKAVEPL